MRPLATVSKIAILGIVKEYSMPKIVLFMSVDKALALLAILQGALPQIHDEVVDSNFDSDAVELFAYANSVYDDIFEQVYKERNSKND